ncbi:FxSxx-COOH system tetratricopeptide repeat protein [Frankia sp. AiPa1]|nr:FxSxx-COOH system tetratricopeptide repeat protein [Frankia sp. AiPa1]
MTRAGAPSAGTISKAFKGDAWPTLAVVRAIVVACGGGGDLEIWTARYRTARALDAASPPGRRTESPAAQAHGGEPGRHQIWRLPAPRNPCFVARDRELAILRAGLSDTTAGSSWVLCGLGGVGKTGLAVEYCYRYRVEYDLVWWVPAEDPVSATCALANLADELGMATAGDADRSVRAVVAVLGRGIRFPRWLIVLDNAERAEEIHGLLGAAARAPGGHVLVTSRHRDWSWMARTLTITELPRTDAVRLLREQASSLTEADAGRIADLLGCLPLALQQAGTWIANTGIAPAAYLELVLRRTNDVLSHGAPQNLVPVAATWTVGLTAAEGPAMERMLQLWAWFGSAPVPVSWIHPGVADVLPPPLAEIAADVVRFLELVATMVEGSLVSQEGGSIMLHRLVRTVTRASTPASLRPVMIRAVHVLLAAAHRDARATLSDWSQVVDTYPHVIDSGLVDSDDPDGRDLVLWLIWALRAAGDHPNSRRLGELVFARWSATLGVNHPDTMLAALNLSSTLWAQRDYNAARTLATASGACDENGNTDVGIATISRLRATFGRDHRHVISATASIAAVAWYDSDYDVACELFGDVLSHARQVLGESHPHTIRAAAYLGAAMLGKGNVAAARPLLTELYHRAVGALGFHHADTTAVRAMLVENSLPMPDKAGRTTIGAPWTSDRARC